MVLSPQGIEVMSAASAQEAVKGYQATLSGSVDTYRHAGHAMDTKFFKGIYDLAEQLRDRYGLSETGLPINQCFGKIKDDDPDNVKAAKTEGNAALKTLWETMYKNSDNDANPLKGLVDKTSAHPDWAKSAISRWNLSHFDAIPKIVDTSADFGKDLSALWQTGYTRVEEVYAGMAQTHIKDEIARNKEAYAQWALQELQPKAEEYGLPVIYTAVMKNLDDLAMRLIFFPETVDRRYMLEKLAAEPGDEDKPGVVDLSAMGDLKNPEDLQRAIEAAQRGQGLEGVVQGRPIN